MIGVYAIRNLINGECYVGSSRNIKQRWRKHKHNLRKGKGEHPPLNMAWLLYGEKCFELVVLCECQESDLFVMENKWLNAQPTYNTFTVANGKGRVVSAETLERMSASAMGHRHTEETRRKMSRTRTGSKRPQQTKDKMKEAWVRRKQLANSSS